MNTTLTTYEKTLQGLSQGLQVGHIATFDISTCSPDEQVSEVFKRYPDFDQVPVKVEGRIVGVLERNDCEDGSVTNSMRPLDDSLLVSKAEPLLDFIPLMASAPYYRLVLEGMRVNGVVTRSDFLKLPVRLLGFTLVSNLELMMTELIYQEFPKDDDWKALLTQGRLEKLNDKWKHYQQKRLDPPLLELTEYADKKMILKKHFKLPQKFESDLRKIEDLRNQIAHAANYAENEEALEEFIQRIELAHYWIDELGKMMR